MKAYINLGHDTKYDSGACGYDMREADVVAEVGELIKKLSSSCRLRSNAKAI